MACCKKFDKWKSGCKGWKPSVFIVVFISMLSTATGQTVADTFDTADIPTNLGSYSPSCNGPLTKLSHFHQVVHGMSPQLKLNTT